MSGDSHSLGARFDAFRARDPGAAGTERERLLLLAVLEEAVACYERYAGARDQQGRALFFDAKEWIDSHDHASVFAFESICEALDLDPGYVRRGLRERCERARAARAPQRPAERARPVAGRRPRHMAGNTPASRKTGS